MTSLNVLMLEDNPDDVLLIKRELSRAGFKTVVQVTQTEAEYLGALSPVVDVVLSDHNLPGYDAVRALAAIRERGLDVPFILISGVLSEEIAVEMMKRGAADYLLKDRLSRLGVAVQNALDERRIRAAAEDERAKAQHLLSELDRERALNEQRSRLVQFATHELKNPLTSIRSSAESLLRYFEKMEEDRRLQHLEIIFSGTSRLLEMINDLLTLGRLDEGISVMTPIRIDLDVLLLGIVDQFRHTYSEQPMFCSITPADYQIQGDPRLLRQIIENLLGNAVRYSPDHRPITVGLAREGAAWLSMKISDNGIGIRPEELPYMFEPFRRGTNTKDIPGTGLGLAIVKQSVELHGGTIQVESAPGQGTTFTVLLPVMA